MSSQKNIYKNIWFPFTSSQDAQDYPPVVIERGQGMYVYDAQGKAYLDAIGSWWVNLFGHNHPRITAAVKAQLDKLEHVLMAGFIAEPTLRLTKLLAALMPPSSAEYFIRTTGRPRSKSHLKWRCNIGPTRATKSGPNSWR